jgi:hypothetical protein
MPELIRNEEMVLKQLNSLKIDKSPGPDELHPRLLKELAKSLTKPFGIIFNQSLRLKMIPKEWKKATISAIFKKGNRSMAGNYRPVSLTSAVCKLLEKIIREHIRDRPFNLQGGGGGLWFFVSFRIIFSDNTWVTLEYFCSGFSRI